MKGIKNKVKEWGLILSIIIGCFASALMILQNVENFKQVTLEKEIAEVDYLTHLLIKQEADVFSALIFHNVKREELQSKLDKFAKEQIVKDVSLYAANGNLLAISKKQDFDNIPNISQKQDIVEPIYYKDNLEGFLRITLVHPYLEDIQRNTDRMFHYLYAQEIILFLLGGILMMSLNYFLKSMVQHSKQKKIEKAEINPLISNTKKRPVSSDKTSKNKKRSKRKKK